MPAFLEQSAEFRIECRPSNRSRAAAASGILCRYRWLTAIMYRTSRFSER